jgi:hypothetical protein
MTNQGNGLGKVPPEPLSARGVVDRVWRAIELQAAAFQPIPSITQSPPGHAAEQLFAQLVHAELLVISLARLCRLAKWLETASWVTVDLEIARQEMLAHCPVITDLRHTAEHFDEYIAGRGRRQERGEEPSGWGFIAGRDPSITYGPHQGIRLLPLIETARRFRTAIRTVVDPLDASERLP